MSSNSDDPGRPKNFRWDIDSHEMSSPSAIDCSAPHLLNLSESRHGLPDGWSMYVHPRGSIYFRERKRMLVTDDDIRDPQILEQLRSQRLQIPDAAAALHLELHMNDISANPLVLYIRHDQQIASYDAEKVTDAAIQTASIPQLVRQRRLYWTFVHQHPVHVTFPETALTEARDAVRSYQTDYWHYGRKMVAPFSKAECDELWQLMSNVQEERTPTTTALIAWLLRQIYNFRCVDGFGQMTHPQLGQFRRTLLHPPEIDVNPTIWSRILLALLMNFLFLGIPKSYLAHVQSATVFRGRLSSLQESWEVFTKQLIQEYSDFILVATVLLSATIGMLAVPNVEQVSKVFSLISIFASLGSITIGVFFTWRHQRHEQMPENNTFAYIHNARNNAFGLPGHAILLSLPPVLLVWALISFTVAVVAYTLQTITGGAEVDVASTWVTIIVFFLVCAAVFAGLYTFTIIWKWQSQQLWTSRCIGRRRARAAHAHKEDV